MSEKLVLSVLQNSSISSGLHVRSSNEYLFVVRGTGAGGGMQLGGTLDGQRDEGSLGLSRPFFNTVE